MPNTTLEFKTKVNVLGSNIQNIDIKRERERETERERERES